MWLVVEVAGNFMGCTKSPQFCAEAQNRSVTPCASAHLTSKSDFESQLEFCALFSQGFAKFAKLCQHD